VDITEDRSAILSHARWQLEMARVVIERVGGEATATRLLGSAQGILLAAGLVTVGETWRENKKWLDSSSIRAFGSAMADLASAEAPVTGV
jgi:hypothetical protein